MLQKDNIIIIELSIQQWYSFMYTCVSVCVIYNLIKNSQAVKKGAAPIKAMVKKDVKSKVAAKKWL